MLQIPELKTDEEKLRFLLAIKHIVPKLFTDAVVYDVDLFALLDANRELLNKLIKDPDYIKEFKKRDKLLKLSVSSAVPGSTIKIAVTNEAVVLAEWKSEMTEFLKSLQEQ